jgi:dTMP kinase
MADSIKVPGGFFIALEGIDGTGKTTLTKRLGETLSSLFEVYETREPSDTEAGRTLRESFIKGRLSPMREAELFVKDRRIHIEREIEPFLSMGQIVITDRYFFSNIAYQGAEGVPMDKLKEMNSGFPLPDMVLYIDIDVDTALRRINSTRGVANLMETREGILRVKGIYENLARDYQDIFLRLDGLQSIDGVMKSSLNVLLNRIEGKLTDKTARDKLRGWKSTFMENN